MSTVWTVILMRWENSISSGCGLRRKFVTRLVKVRGDLSLVCRLKHPEMANGAVGRDRSRRRNDGIGVDAVGQWARPLEIVDGPFAFQHRAGLGPIAPGDAMEAWIEKLVA